jgi:L-lactate dehydrogenase (cytochrome)
MLGGRREMAGALGCKDQRVLLGNHSQRCVAVGKGVCRCKTKGSLMRLSGCHNFHDFRRLAMRRLPRPLFDYIDGAADDEATYPQNTLSFERCNLVPNVLRGVDSIDLSTTVMGQRLALPFYCSPTALQRPFHHQGERAVAAAASKCGTMFGASSLGTVSMEELRQKYRMPQVYQFYSHKDRGLNRAML